MPPRHGKSELASRRFPAWYLGRNPGKQIICASYGADLANDFGREVRNIVSSEEYSRIFSTTLAQDSKAANRWHTNKGGVYVAAGVGGPITGRGAHLALIDDPIKDREEAESETIREKVWNWYTSTLYTRLMPGGCIVVIQTRWHEDDLAGRLLNGEEKWELLELPAVDDGKALWPEWYPIETLDRIKTAIGPRDWSALYQQQPQPEDGTYFQRDWFKRYRPGNEPERLNKYAAADYAVSDGKGDFTEIGIAGFDKHEDLYFLDWWSGQKTADVWIDAELDLINKHKPMVSVSEGGPIRRSIEPFLDKRMRQRKSYCRKEWLTSNKDKTVLARAFQALASMGKVYIPNTEWGDELINQLVSFPTGKYDDKVDVCGLFGRLLDQTYGPRETKQGQPEELDAWGRRFKGTGNWKTA